MARTQTNGSAEKNAEKAYADLEMQIATLKSDVAQLTSTLGDFAQAQKEQLGVAASDSIDAAKKLGIAKAEAAQAQARDAVAGAERAVRANPMASVGFAAGAGFLAGLLATRR
ncbi:DUF883 family protein [Poseidonocella sedimentorum]|uniref:Membrane-anchored ribosome-binding protein, inhibits growth in stationary phase, ElaB/YqjD/DUF883 family n=1 Tax=Poseidonocella sedimentorum TaxID=871652 RepID=A0A1I6DTE7_9RHOB|nr:DUF883 family protein [Poseidonocella sedimentorum]SFR08696.1 Membrane-anchored ribosome-binding protein, inhibits growth in stationary phase, ElaB/YqjD/DUF883 family [Poseidonocella sedimentorum]